MSGRRASAAATSTAPAKPQQPPDETSAPTPSGTSAASLADVQPKHGKSARKAYGRRADAAAASKGSDSDEAEMPLVWTREMHLAAVQRKIQESGVSLDPKPGLVGFRKALA